MRHDRTRRWGGSVLMLLVAAASLGSVTCAAERPLNAPARPALAARDEPAQIRAELAALLGRMNTAVLAADQAGYLACTSTSDPCFTTEQRNWAKDLERKAPESFEVALSESEATVEGDMAEARLTWTWRMPGAKERTLSFIGRFVRREPGAGGGGEPGGWLYAGEKWNVLEGERCRVLYADGLAEPARIVADVLPGIRAHVHEGFQLEGDKDLTERTQQVKLYGSMRHLQHSIYLSYSDGLAGWNEPAEAVKILARAGTGAGSLKVLLSHEYGHVATFQLGPKATDMPWWILEGMAELSSEKYGGGRAAERLVRLWAKNDGLIEWDRLADFHGEAVEHMTQVYNQGHAMVSYISTRFGREARNRWLRELGKGTSLDGATRAALGLPFAELDADWHKTLSADPPP